MESAEQAAQRQAAEVTARKYQLQSGVIACLGTTHMTHHVAAMCGLPNHELRSLVDTVKNNLAQYRWGSSTETDPSTSGVVLRFTNLAIGLQQPGTCDHEDMRLLIRDIEITALDKDDKTQQKVGECGCGVSMSSSGL